MSKNLESEYKNFINDQIPDLWDRIEANLGEQEPAGAADTSAQTQHAETGNNAGSPVRPLNNAAPRRRIWKPILGIAAAAACVCIVVPIALSVGSGRGMGSAAMTAEALPEEFNYAEADAAAEPYYGEEMVAADAAAEEAASAETFYPAGEPAAEEKAAYETTEAAVSDEASGRERVKERTAIGSESAKSAGESEYDIEEYEEAAEAMEIEEAAEVPEAEEAYEEAAAEEPVYAKAYTLTNVEIKITSVSEEDLAAHRVTAEVIACPDEPSLAGSILTIESSDDTEGVPAEPGIYIRNIFVIVEGDGTLVYKI